MTLIFPYVRVPIRRPAVALGGLTYRPRPLIPVSLVGPTNTRLVYGLVDSGADDTVFPESLANQIGLDLTGAPEGESGSFTGGPNVPVRFATVTLRLATQTERREWSALIGFTSAPMRHGLLGYAGALQFFATNLRGDAEIVELTVNSLYPGT
jgi:hypothetical protein